MSYTNATVWEKKLPPFSGLVLVIVLFVTISALTSNVVLFGTRAAIGGTPRNVQITNVSSTSFTVTYETDEAVFGSIRYGANETLGSVSLDDRDQVTAKADEHRVHHITVKNLTPGTKYVFEISSGNETYKNNDALYEASTVQPLSNPPAAQQLTGEVALDDGSIPAEGIVYVQAGSSQTLSALLRPDGSYTLPLSELRSIDLSSWFPLTAETQLSVTVTDSRNKTNASLLADQTNPAPLMVLAQNYDFTLDDTKLAADATGSASASDSATASSSATLPLDLPIPEDTTQATSPVIIVPKPQQSFNDQQPKFQGKALPLKAVEITIGPQESFVATIQSDENGNWEFRPETLLTPGQYELIIKSPDFQGTMQTVTQQFTIAAEGSQFIEPSISPEALPTPAAPPPTLVPVTATPSATPTLEPPTSTPLPTVDPSSFITQDPNANGNPVVPNAGSNSWIIGLAGVVLATGVGALLFFFI